jgi:hypothetical protein
MRRFYGIFLLLLIVFSIYSCSIERELARDFIDKSKNMPVLLLSTDNVIFTNEKLKKISGFDSLSVKKQDSLWSVNTVFLDSIDDVKLISIIFNKFKSNLESYCFKVFTKENKKDFDNINQEKYIINLAQFEVSEDIYTHRDEEYFFDSILYYQDVDLNIVGINFWIELSDLKENNPKILFKDYYISDKLNSRFVLDEISYNVNYRYKITPLKLSDIYTYANSFSEDISDCLFNYLMNNYIKLNSADSQINIKQFIYDKHTRFLYQNNELLFQEIKK